MKISIITVCFNSERTIEKTLKSVAFQTYCNIEHIVFDGNSTDKTVDIVKKFKHISILESKKDNGVYFALNNAMNVATGDIIALLHADDFYYNEFVVEQIVSTFEQNNIDVIYADLQYVSQDNKVVRYWKAGHFEPKKLFFGWMPPHPTIFFKTEVLKKIGGFDTNFKISADYDWILRVFNCQEIKIAYLPQVVVNMTIGGLSNGSLKNIFLKSKEDFLAIKKNNIGNFFTLIFKNFRKISQFYKRP